MGMGSKLTCLLTYRLKGTTCRSLSESDVESVNPLMDLVSSFSEGFLRIIRIGSSGVAYYWVHSKWLVFQGHL